MKSKLKKIGEWNFTTILIYPTEKKRWDIPKFMPQILQDEIKKILGKPPGLLQTKTLIIYVKEKK